MPGPIQPKTELVMVELFPCSNHMRVSDITIHKEVRVIDVSLTIETIVAGCLGRTKKVLIKKTAQGFGANQ